MFNSKFSMLDIGGVKIPVEVIKTMDIKLFQAANPKVTLVLEIPCKRDLNTDAMNLFSK